MVNNQENSLLADISLNGSKQIDVIEVYMPAISGFQSSLLGIQRGMDALSKDAHTIATQSVKSSASDKDVTEALVNLIPDSTQVEASAKTLKVQDQLIGTLLDELA